MFVELIDLDECVIDALDLFTEKQPPKLALPFKRPLVVGSGNAAVTGRIIFEDKDAVFADESTYEAIMQSRKIDGALLISASGAKHAPIIAKKLKGMGVPIHLLTCSPDAPAKAFADKTYVSPKNTEPYTYNTSTYMGMILSHTQEDTGRIRDFLQNLDLPENFDVYDAFYIIVPKEFDTVRELFLTKFDELFGPKINGRVFTPEQTKHAKTVVQSDSELFISLGYDNTLWGTKRLNIDLPDDIGPGGIMAIGYYIIGQIQKQHPSYFKENIERYTEKVSKLFESTIKPIVD